MTAKPQFDPNKSRASLCRKRFFFFVQTFWHCIIEEEPEWNWHIEYLCDEIQKVLELVIAGEPKMYDLIINVSPGESKSTITSVMITPWLWTRMPHARTINGSFQQDLSLEMSRKARDIIQHKLYKLTFPDVQIRKDQNTKGNFVNTAKGQRISTSTGAGITGKHAHVLVVDDPLDPNQAASDLELKEANNWITNVLMSRKVNKKVTPLIMVMQRLHQLDPTGSRLKSAMRSNGKDKVKHICLPATDDYKIRPKRLRQFYVNGLMNPKRTDRSVLEEVESVSGRILLACQYGQDPKPADGGMFKMTHWRVMSKPPEKFARIVRYWDKAGTFNDGAWTVGMKMGLELIRRGGPGSKLPPLRLYWILDVKRFREDASERERLIKKTAEEDGKEVVIVVEEEGGSGGKESAQATVSNLSGFRVKRDKPVGDKALRADPASDQWNNGCFRILEGDWNDDLKDELEYFPLSAFKDQGDALSGGFAFLTKKRKKIGAVR